MLDRSRPSMNAHCDFGDENLKLFECFEQLLFEFANEAGAAAFAEVEGGQDNHLIEVSLLALSPNATEWERTLLDREAAKLAEQLPLDFLEIGFGDGATVVERERQIDLVAPGGSSHASF